MEFVLASIVVVGLVVLANVLETADDDTYNTLFDRLLLALNLPLLLVGVTMLTVPPEVIQRLRQTGGVPLQDVGAAGVALIVMATWGVAASLSTVRRWLARFLPLQAESPVHALALVFSGYLVGNTLLTLSQGGLVQIAEVATAASVYDVVLQQLLFVILAFLGVGLLIRRDGQSLNERLGLERITPGHIRFGLRWIVILVIVQWAMGGLWALLSPDQSELINNVSEQLFADFDTVWEWFVLALSAGFGEELLFRGALQPVFGLTFTSVLFAVSHVQYGITPVTLAVLIIGFVLGYIRRRTSTSVAIFVHFGYNFVLGLLALLASALEPFTNGL